MPTPKPKPKYPGTQAELYAVCKLGWASYDENVADFTAFKTFYDAAYGTTALGEVTAAQALPDDQARGAAAEMLNIDMKQAAAAAILKWKSLRAYIKSAYAPEMVKPQEEAAGYGYYDTATNNDWEDLEQMLISGETFITANAADLTADGGMPAAFAADYTAAKTAFSDLYGDFKDSEQDSQEGTDIKIDANNAIYDKLIAMFGDGQVIYDGNPAKRDRFIYAQVKALVTPPGGGGGGIPETSLEIKGKVTNAETGNPIEGAQVALSIVDDPEHSETVFSNVNGDYEFVFEGLPAGESGQLHHVVTALDFLTKDQNIAVEVGQSYTVDVAMSPVAPPPLP